MLVMPQVVSDWIGLQAPLALQFIGFGLILFAGELLYQATRPRMATWRALLASVADVSWVAGTFALLLFFPHMFSSTGNMLVLAVAVIVLCFGVWQLWGAGRAHRATQAGEYRHCIVVETNAPADKMWHIVGDMGGIERYMPSLKRSLLLDGKAPGVGAIRACEDRAGKAWSEECIAFEAGRGFAVRFLSEAPDFPFPAKTMRGGWDVTPSAAGSQVMVWWELTPKQAFLAPILLPLLAFQADRDFPKIVKRMAEAAIGGSRESHAQNGVVVRLLPVLC